MWQPLSVHAERCSKAHVKVVVSAKKKNFIIILSGLPHRKLKNNVYIIVSKNSDQMMNIVTEP